MPSFSRLFLPLVIGRVNAAPVSDAVPHLPGYGAPPAPQWSGYLDASAEEPGTMLHYWFAMGEMPNPQDAPVVLWLNGGPGSSSILGMLQEMGPLVINATGGLMRNPYAWTKQANLLIIESPAGVGYSFCAAMKSGGSCHNTDDSTAKAARAAVQFFFREKFPELRTNDFFITGESYAGVYVPTLTQELLLHAPEVNIKGLAVGDPCTDQESQAMTEDMIWYSHKYGLLPDADFDFLWNNCSFRHPSLLESGTWLREAGGRWAEPAMTRLEQANFPTLDLACKVAQRRYLLTTSRGISQSWSKAYINELDFYNDANPFNFKTPGNTNYDNAQWMMREDVKKALHLEEAPVKEWPGPPEGWSYKSQYSACHKAPAGTDSMIQFYRRIAPQLRTTIVFNGDTDPCVTYEGTRTAIEKVGFDVIPGGEYRPWFYNKSAAAISTLEEKPTLFGPNLAVRDAGAQFGGQVVNYAHNLSFVTVHGAGHMVPQFRPQSAERLLGRLITGKAFSPLLPTGEELAVMTDAEFRAMTDEWTDRAESMVTGSSISSNVVV